MCSRLLLLPSLLVLILTPSCKGKEAASDVRGDVKGDVAVDGSTMAATPAASASASAAPSSPTPSGPMFEGAIAMRMVHRTDPPHDVTMMTKGGKLRVDVPTRDGVTAHAIIDSDTGKATLIVDKEKLAMGIDLPTTATAQQGPPPTITRTGKHETIAGRDCEDWDVVEAVDGKREQLCVTEGIAFLDFSTIAPPGSMGVTMGSWLTELREKHEFPLRAVTLDDTGKEESRMEVTKIEAKPIDDAVFTVPKGYGRFDAAKLGVQNRLLPPAHPR